MKKAICLLVLAFSLQSINAQIQAGGFMVGGKVGFSSESNSEDEDYKLTSFKFKPEFGYFFIDKLAGGIRGSIETGKYYDESYTDLLIGPFVRYYFLQAAMRTNIFLDGSYKFGSQKSGGGDSFGTSQFGIGGGVDFFISRCFAIEMMLRYSSFKYSDFDDRYNTIAFLVGFQLFLNGSKGSK